MEKRMRKSNVVLIWVLEREVEKNSGKKIQRDNNILSFLRNDNSWTLFVSRRKAQTGLTNFFPFPAQESCVQ